ncbi:hypothetical protein Y032_0299g1789 [Ancylostoma ceylanicum]|uniref:Uncharacterized protein n=1 Tax=Ancylostoma ceylanicum TaxID=53326 RepID=A0A016S402_9BILA|nr:hypothetical protein Y032_0299g1789 [Ancylostoma ceylanicum]
MQHAKIEGMTPISHQNLVKVSPDFATTAGERHMDEVKEETPNETDAEFRLAAIHSDVTWQSIRIISTILISCIAGSI